MIPVENIDISELFWYKTDLTKEIRWKKETSSNKKEIIERCS